MIEFFRYRDALPSFVWPKSPPPLTEAQKKAREAYMLLWHQQLSSKYRMIEEFNHGYVAHLPRAQGSMTLEIGAGLGAHLKHEGDDHQNYHVLEFREEFCREIRKRLPESRVQCGDIHDRQPWESATFDRIVAIHVLEHLVDLPKALREIGRLLKPDGVLDIVIPCEGGLAHTFARTISAERLFTRRFGMDFLPIHLNEHVNSYNEVIGLLRRGFVIEKQRYFPLRIPLPNLNVCAGFRLRNTRSASAY
jgi:SAM-dependent methyltransferase